MWGKDAQQLLVSCLLFILTLYTKNNVNLMLLLADAQSSESEDSEDESYAASIASSVSLGSQDTEIEEGEVDDLAIDAATMPTPKPVRKKSPVPSAAPITATAPAKKRGCLYHQACLCFWELVCTGSQPLF